MHGAASRGGIRESKDGCDELHGRRPYGEKVSKLIRGIEEHAREPRSRFWFRSPCWASAQVDFAVHRVLPAMLREKSPKVAARLVATSPRWGRSHGQPVPLPEASGADRGDG